MLTRTVEFLGRYLAAIRLTRENHAPSTTNAWNESPAATMDRPCFRMNLDLLDSSARGVEISRLSSSVRASLSTSRSESMSSSMPRKAKLMYQSQATLRTIFPKKLVHSSRDGGLLLASLAELPGPLLFPLSRFARLIRFLGEGEERDDSPSPSFPSIPTYGIESPLLNSVGTSASLSLRTLSDGNGSEIPSSSGTSTASESMTIRGSVGSSPIASAASGVIPFPGIGTLLTGYHYFPWFVSGLLRSEPLLQGCQ